MRVEIRAAGEDGGDELRDFFRWLEQDEDGPEQLRLETRSAGGADGAMGPEQVIDLVLNQGVALANFALAYVTWRGTRREQPTDGFTFRRASDGLTVTVNGGSEEAVRQVLTVLAQAPVLPPVPLLPPTPAAGSPPGVRPSPGVRRSPAGDPAPGLRSGSSFGPGSALGPGPDLHPGPLPGGGPNPDDPSPDDPSPDDPGPSPGGPAQGAP